MKKSQIKERIVCWDPGDGSCPNFAKGDSPLAVSGAAISRLQPEGHTNISRSEADLEIRVSDFESTASGGSGALPHVGRARIALGREVAGSLANR